jgi:LytR cell envelope-related transcriptional attenuator
MQADKIIGVGFEQIETDLTKVQCLALASIMKGSGSQSMASSTVPGTNQKRDGLYYFILDEEKAKATVDWLIKGDEEAMKKTLQVEVFNGTKTQGAAAKAAKILIAKGYSVTVSGNGPPTTITKVVYRKATFEGQAKQIQQIFGAMNITKDAASISTGPDISVTVGDDISKSIQGMS